MVNLRSLHLFFNYTESAQVQSFRFAVKDRKSRQLEQELEAGSSNVALVNPVAEDSQFRRKQ